jgi:prephenate dehydratase
MKALYCRDIEGVFNAVLEGKAEYGVVPVENSLEGSISLTQDLLLEKDVRIYGEIVLDIHHDLVGLSGVRLEEIREVLSHPHALAQCKKFLRELGVKTRSSPSTAEAAKEVAERKTRSMAAVASRYAGELYGLQVLRRDIQDEGSNQTRFLVLSLRDPKRVPEAKTSLILGLRDRPGALYGVLGFFAAEGINLTKIESRPSKKALGEYLFYLDFEGHQEDEAASRVLRALRKEAPFVKVLGSYPREP